MLASSWKRGECFFCSESSLCSEASTYKRSPVSSSPRLRNESSNCSLCKHAAIVLRATLLTVKRSKRKKKKRRNENRDKEVSEEVAEQEKVAERAEQRKLSYPVKVPGKRSELWTRNSTQLPHPFSLRRKKRKRVSVFLCGSSYELIEWHKERLPPLEDAARNMAEVSKKPSICFTRLPGILNSQPSARRFVLSFHLFLSLVFILVYWNLRALFNV